jgi:hypothetical protein
MGVERRKQDSQTHDSLDDILNEAQLVTLNNMEGFGWSLAFVRKPLFQEVVPVLVHADNDKLGTLDKNGKLNVRPDIKLRYIK